MSKITRTTISQKWLNQKKKKVHPSYIFLHLSANFWLKLQNTHRYRNWGTFSTPGQLPLIRLKCQFAKKPSTVKKFEMYPDML